ncbi:MAG: hypothetical protein AB7R89_04155 [Dehalococcoidia bacterium]
MTEETTRRPEWPTVTYPARPGHYHGAFVLDPYGNNIQACMRRGGIALKRSSAGDKQ